MYFKWLVIFFYFENRTFSKKIIQQNNKKIINGFKIILRYFILLYYFFEKKVTHLIFSLWNTFPKLKNIKDHFHPIVFVKMLIFFSKTKMMFYKNFCKMKKVLWDIVGNLLLENHGIAWLYNVVLNPVYGRDQDQYPLVLYLVQSGVLNLVNPDRRHNKQNGFDRGHLTAFVNLTNINTCPELVSWP